MSLIAKEGFFKNQLPLIFHGMKFEQKLVMGLEYSPELVCKANEQYLEILNVLHRRMNHGENVQPEIDRYLLALHMISCNSPLLLQHPCSLFVIEPEHVFTVNDLPDIGRYISRLIINQIHTTVDLMSKLIHYSMPYIKHNRMNFPAFAPEHAAILPDIVNIMLASCLGIYPECTKKPLLAIRVQIVAFIHTLKSTGNALDLYVFCTTNMCLLRIAMIEYFVFFISTHMPNETEMLTQVFGLHQNIADIFKQFSVICDTFRQQCLQSHSFDINEVNSKAQVAIDKCNRVCKGKSRNQPRHCKKHRSIVISSDVIAQAISKPFLPHVSYVKFANVHIDLRNAHEIIQIQSWVSIFELPRNIRKTQLQIVSKILHDDTVNTIQTLFMHICMACVVNDRICLDTKMRVMANGRATCTTCSQHQCVVRIYVLGRVVRIKQNAFYYCSACMRVHAWRATGCEFSHCHLHQAKKITQPRVKCCAFCTRTNNLEALSVLDDERAILQQIFICNRHMPSQHVLPYIDNLQGLKTAVTEKIQSFNTR